MTEGGPHAVPADLLAVLCCPTCADDRPVHVDHDAVVCDGGHAFPVVRGVPVFSDAGRDVEIRPADHVSNQPPDDLIGLVTRVGRPWLHLGAGATDAHLKGSIELESAIFGHTDVVADAARLPFRSGSLTGALALNVFEHLAEPGLAAGELARVLRGGGVVVVQTAFLQPLHADPGHFFNATEQGVRRWFRDFDVREVTVPGNFNPAFTLSWLASDLLFHTPDERLRQTLSAATLGDLAALWRDPSARTGRLFDAFLRVPEPVQRILAAGFQVVAERPPREP